MLKRAVAVSATQEESCVPAGAVPEDKADIRLGQCFAALRQLSVGIYAEKIVRALAKRKCKTRMHTISKVIGVDFQDTYDAVHELMAHGLVEREEVLTLESSYFVYWLDASGWRRLKQQLDDLVALVSVTA